MVAIKGMFPLGLSLSLSLSAIANTVGTLITELGFVYRNGSAVFYSGTQFSRILLCLAIKNLCFLSLRTAMSLEPTSPL